MATTVTYHYGKNRTHKQAKAPQAHKTQPIAIPSQTPAQASKSVAVPAQDQYRTVVKPRFIGDSFVYVPVRVPTHNADGSPIKSPGEAFMDWLFGTKR